MSVQRVLIIDDEPAVRLSVSAVLQQEGFAVVCASSVAEGARLIADTSPDLIISDIFLDDGEGLEALSQVRAQPALAAVPFILMTGRFTHDVARRGMELGADDVLIKPFDADQLLGAVAARLNRVQLFRRKEEFTRRKMLAMIDDSPVLIGMCAAAPARVEFLNRAGREMAGIPTAIDVTALSLPDLFQIGRDEKDVRAAIDHALREGSWSADALLRKQPHGELPVSLLITSHHSADGSVAYLSLMARDLTSRLKAEEDLRRSEAMLRSVMENADELICVLDPGGRQLWCNPAFERAFATERAAANGAMFSTLVHPDDSEAVTAALARACELGRSGPFEYRAAPSGNRIRFFEASSSLISDAGGRPFQLITIARDVTERRKAESERDIAKMLLQQAQKLESIGRLTAGIAHEINTPTQFVGDNLRFLNASFGDISGLLLACDALTTAAAQIPALADAVAEVQSASDRIDLEYLRQEIPKCLEQSIEGVQRVARIVQAMKDFSHPGCADKAPVDINRAIESTSVVARNEWKYVADLALELDPHLGAVPCIEGEFNQVVLNLIVNSAHAIAEKLGPRAETKGRITIRTRRLDGWAEVRIQDTGGGIPPHVAQRLFEPFFTTKPLGKGTGQGLALARSVVVDRHGGEISYETEVGVGTCFIVRLPLNSLPLSSAA